MKKITRVVLGSVLIASVILASVVHAEFLGNNKNNSNVASAATAYFVKSNGSISAPSKDLSKPVGSAENPFFVLEIVPWDRRAEFGYQIAGCEPLDLEKAGWAGLTLPDNKVCLEEKQVFKGYWPDEMPSWIADGTISGGQDETLPYLGTMTKTNGKGNYKLTGETTVNIDGTNVNRLAFTAQENGGYTFTPLSVAEVHNMSYEAKRDYADRDVTKAGMQAAEDGTAIKVNLGDVTAKVNYSAKEYTHKNEFLKYAIGLAYDVDETTGVRTPVSEEEVNNRIANYHAIVYTVTPEDLNMNTGLIKWANLITICKGTKMGYIADAKYFRDDLFSHDTSTTKGSRILNTNGADFTTNPIDWGVAQRIFLKACGYNGICPILIETATRSAGESDLTGTQAYIQKYADGKKIDASISGAQNNMWKLMLMLLQMEPETFCQLYAKDADVTKYTKDEEDKALDAIFGASFTSVSFTSCSIKKKDGGELETGAFKLNQANDNPVKYWAKELFYPYHTMAYSEMDTDDKVFNVCNMFGIANGSGGTYQWLSGAMQNAVRDSVFTYNGDMFASNKMHRDDDQKESVKATDDDVFGYKVYDIFEKANGGSRPSAVDTADIIWAMLHGSSTSPSNPDVSITGNIRILDLEPTSKYSKNATFFKTLLGAQANFTGTVTVTQMTTSEFIGKKVDLLSDFDLVYIGTDLVNNGFTVGDMWTLPDGFVYAHTGRIVTMKCVKAGNSWLDYLLSPNYSANWTPEYSTMQMAAYSGNDITKLVYDKMVAARDAGMLFMYGKDFFTDKDLTKASISGKIDHNSYLYEFANQNISATLSEDALSNAGDYTAWSKERKKLREAVKGIAAKRVDLSFSVLPKLYQNMDKTDAENFINPNASDSRDLVFRFTVNAPAGTDYYVRVFVDSNGDGNFTDNEAFEDTYSVNPMRADGKPGAAISSFKVEGGKEYQVTKDVGSRIGSVHWKLELIRNNTVYYSKSGLSAIKAHNADEIIDLAVLQILPISGITVELPDAAALDAYMNDRTIPLYTDAPANHKYSNENNVRNGKQKFLEKIYNKDGSSKINGMNLSFTVETEAEMKTAIGSSTPTRAEYLAYLLRFRMIVVGFADNYEGIKDQNLVDALEDYRLKGYAVLYSHDTFTHKQKSKGNLITSQYRDTLLSDRYSLISHPATELGATRKDYPWETSATDSSRQIIKRHEDVNGKEVTLAQGYSNGVIYRYVLDSTKSFESQSLTGDESAYAYTVGKIKVINEGAVTSYPYDIGGDNHIIDVASTHMQYFQLDMENDELNVWYTLDGTGTGSNKELFYSSIRGDVRNNYYIYNAGNVTYTGMGHDAGLSSKPKEVELFVNTFVAAYRAIDKSVELVVTNPEASAKSRDDGGKNYFVGIDVDSTDSTKAIGNDIGDSYYLRSTSGSNDTLTYTKGSKNDAPSKRIYFYIKGSSSSGKLPHYVVTAKVNGVTDATKDLAVFKKSDDSFVANATDMKSGQFNVYYVDVPLKIEENTETYADGSTATKHAFAETKLELSVTLWSNDGGVYAEGDSVESIITIAPRGMFDLD